MPGDLERLELLVPEFAHTAQTSRVDARNLQEYALAYVDRYRGDVLQLEHEWGILQVALMEAWRKKHYAVVVRLIAGLAHSIGRMSRLEEAEHLLHMGIAASRYTQDKPHLAYFLNRLGSLFFAHGQYARGRRVWYESVQLAESSGALAGLLEPLFSFAHIADILGNYTASQQFIETLAHTSQDDDPMPLAVATFIRAFHARHLPNLDQAYDDLCYCLRLLASHPTASSLASYQQLFTIVVQIELARVQGDYQRSRAYVETALALAQLFADRYTVAVLLIDQRHFAHELGYQAYAPSILFRPHNGPQPIESLHIYERQRAFEPYLAPTSSSCDNITVTCEQPHASRLAAPTGTMLACPAELRQLSESTELLEALSERELEVLQLIATGLSNRKVAQHLVIMPGTVKKHLEHIYSKLNVHNRTEAIARARMLHMFA
ncbi:MAG: response regulator transcription factor [Chloroflexota bacterium]|nr:response regulator transcription factor [Chloroflexota bacterium]